MNLHPTCSSPDFPISGNGPTQLLKPKASVLLSFGLTPTSNPTIVLTPLAHLCHHSILAYNFIAWPDCSASLPLLFLPFYHSISHSMKSLKNINQTLQLLCLNPQCLRSPLLGPQGLQGPSPQALHLTLPPCALVCFLFFEPASHLPAPGP